MSEKEPQNTRLFKGVWIPAIVFCSDLSPLEKILWADIDSFCDKDRAFYKKNATICAQYNLAQSTVSRAIKNLQEKGFVEVSFDGRNRVIKSLGQDSEIDKTAKAKTKGRVSKSLRQGKQIDKAYKSTNRVTKKEATEEVIELPFESDNFGFTWAEWVREKEDQGKYSPRAKRHALTRLYNLSNGDEGVAIQIIHRSLANSWKGFYKLKDDGQKQGFHGDNFTTNGLSDFIDKG